MTEKLVSTPTRAGEGRPAPAIAEVQLALVRKGIDLCRQGREEVGLPYLSFVWRTAAPGLRLPSVFFGWLGYGLASREGGRYVEGLELCRRAVSQGPAEADNHVNLARALLLLGRCQDAREAAVEGLRAVPGEPRLQELLAILGPRGSQGRHGGWLGWLGAGNGSATQRQIRQLGMDLWTERQERHHLQTHDALTGLGNRSAFLRLAQPAVDFGTRREAGTALLYIDLDDFRTLNETRGVAAGDVLLKEVGRFLEREVEDGGHAARVGGDEFALLLHGVKDEAAVARRASDLRERLARVRTPGRPELTARASVGVAICPRDGRDAATLLVRAESALRRAKDMGGGRCRFFSSPLPSSAAPGVSLESRLKVAMEREELTVYFQPIREARSRRLIGAEALVRWLDKERGAIPPARFIPVAEETGLILPLGEWILGTAMRQWLSWQRKGLVDVPLSVNFSGRQLRYPKQVQRVADVLREVGSGPASLRVEITESSLLQDTSATVASLEVLNRMGIRLSLDDFGTGYSSLKMLRRIPFSHVKIGNCFIHDIGTGREGAALPGAIIALAHELGKCVVAEGVETQQQLAFLLAHDCDEVQGRLLGREMPAEDFEELLRDERCMEDAQAARRDGEVVTVAPGRTSRTEEDGDERLERVVMGLVPAAS